MSCYISRQIDEYIAQQDAAEMEEEYFYHQVEQIMKDDFNPYKPENILEWMGEINDKDTKVISALMEKELDEMLGRYIREKTESYWENKAREHVIKEQDKRMFGII